MKKLILPLVVAGMCALPSLSHAATNPYVSVSGGLGFLGNSTFDGHADAIEYKTGYLVNGAVGLKSEPFRLEAEIGYHRNTVDKVSNDQNVSIWSFMANGYLDYDMKDEGISPFIMAGLGLADVSHNFPGGNDNSSVFAWQAGAGIGIKASDKVTFDVSYRYFSPADATLDGHKVSFGSHNIIAGVRMDF
ncbi:MAG: porin family protein [Chlorobium sp.]|nr:MAG: porin family protein [Chlorobium sp.]